MRCPERLCTIHGPWSSQEAVLDQQQSERTDTEFKRSCLFCGMVVTGNRAPLFQHMLEDHSFNVGQPDNLGESLSPVMTCGI